MSKPLVVEDLWKSYRARAGGEPYSAVRGISFEVAAGECFGLLGPNGAGKSTTMRCVTGFYATSRGRVFLNGYDVHLHPREARVFLGVCSQEDSLDSDFSMFNQMVRYATFFRISVKEAKVRTQHLLELFKLWEQRDEPVEALSGGMRRRLQVARSLISDPKLLILDEPTTGLDPEVRRTLWEIIMERRKQGMAILLSTHYMEEAERLCDRVAILHKGQILDIDTSEQLIGKHTSGAEVSEEVRAGVFWKRQTNLEDVYLKLTGSKLDGGEESC